MFMNHCCPLLFVGWIIFTPNLSVAEPEGGGVVGGVVGGVLAEPKTTEIDLLAVVPSFNAAVATIW
jgi:hypothetical protein